MTDAEKQWLIEYRFNGDVYVIPVHARTPTEAKRKLIVAGTYGIVQGSVEVVMGANAATSVLVRVWCAIKNWATR